MIKLFIISTRQQPSYIFNLININEFVQANIDISFINITKLQNKVPQNFKVEKKNYENIIDFYAPDNYNDFYSIFNFNKENKYYFLFTGWTINNEIILNFCKQKKIYTILLDLIPVNKFSYISIISNNIRSIFLKKSILYNSVIVGGHYKILFYKSIGYNDVWEIHTHIFEEYIKNINNVKTDSYLLYIDQNFLKHPDITWFNIDINSFEHYYTLINSFLKKQSTLYNLPVKIALHPTSDIKLYRKMFPNFMLYKNKTFNLMNNAKIIYGHYSNSLDYAVLIRKPMVLIDIENSLSPKLSNNLHTFANKIGIKPINPHRKDKVLTTDHNSYHNYIYRFIKSKKNLTTTFSSILLDHIKNIK